jgi:hypothetical protein
MHSEERRTRIVDAVGTVATNQRDGLAILSDKDQEEIFV